MHRIYCPHADFSSGQIAITDKNELHHLRNVLRIKKDCPVQLFDGNGREASALLSSVSTRMAGARIQSVRQISRPKPWLCLACAVPKKDKFETIVEKATELGVDEIIPLTTCRTELRLNNERHKKKSVRYQTVAINAVRQSHRCFIPTIHSITKFPVALERLTKKSTAFIPSLIGKREKILSAFQKLPSPDAVSFLIGPEGDFTPDEYDQARISGCIAITLGDAVLKVDTAALSAISCASLFFRH